MAAAAVGGVAPWLGGLNHIVPLDALAAGLLVVAAWQVAIVGVRLVMWALVLIHVAGGSS